MLAIPPTRNHRQLADWINANVLVDTKRRAVRAVVQQWTSNTDTKIGRLRIAGRGRRGLLLEVKLAKSMDVLYSHESGETYRRHREAREWVAKNLHHK